MNLIFSLALGAALLSPAAVQAQAAPPPQAAPAPVGPPTLYVIRYRAGPAWKEGRPLREQGLESHGAYMMELARNGDLLVAGPLATNDGGYVILRSESLEAATERMMADPAVRDNKFVGEVSAWRPLIDLAGRFSSAPEPTRTPASD